MRIPLPIMGGVFLFYTLNKLTIGKTKSWIHGKELMYSSPGNSFIDANSILWECYLPTYQSCPIASAIIDIHASNTVSYSDSYVITGNMFELQAPVHQCQIYEIPDNVYTTNSETLTSSIIYLSTGSQRYREFNAYGIEVIKNNPIYKITQDDTAPSDLPNNWVAERIGRVGLRLTKSPTIAIGTYIGTGVSGYGHPTRITFQHKPYLVIVYTGSVNVDGFSMNKGSDGLHPQTDVWESSFIWTPYTSRIYVSHKSSGNDYLDVVQKDTYLEWFTHVNTDSQPEIIHSSQLNRLNKIYRYIAFIKEEG